MRCRSRRYRAVPHSAYKRFLLPEEEIRPSRSTIRTIPGYPKSVHNGLGGLDTMRCCPEDAVTHKASAATSLAECSPGNDFNRGR